MNQSLHPLNQLLRQKPSKKQIRKKNPKRRKQRSVSLLLQKKKKMSKRMPKNQYLLQNKIPL